MFLSCTVLKEKGVILNDILEYFIFLRLYFYLFSERGREGKREGEKHPFVASDMSPTQDLASNLGTFPDWELNRQPFSLQAGA